MRSLVFLLCGLLAVRAAESAKSHRDFRTEGDRAYDRKDYPAATAAMAAALSLRPDSARYLYNLAALSALTGDKPAALGYLRRVAALGVFMHAGRDSDFAILQGTRDFNEVLRVLANNREPQGRAEVLAELPGRTGLIEGIAFRPRTSDLFFGDVHHRCIWRRDDAGRITRFTAEDDEILGVFGVALDETRNTLWAATSALPEMSGFTKENKGQAALAEFNLGTSELRRVIPVPGDGRDHQLNDLVVASDGTIYATDSAAPVLWRLSPGVEEIEKFVESRDFASLQGIAIVNRTLLVADHANGLFAIDPDSGHIRALAPPAGTTLLGIDGVVGVPGGLVATQNGIEPARVVHVALAPDLATIQTVTILAAGLPYLTDLTLVTLVNDRPAVVANSGWDGFDPAKAPHPPAHPVRIFQVTFP